LESNNFSILPYSSKELAEKLSKLGNWMYKFDLAEGITTKLHVDWLQKVHDTRYKMIFSKIDPLFKDRWNEIKCLDVACNEGFFGFELCKRGCKEVIAFDARAVNIEKAQLIQNHFDYKNIKFFLDDIYNLEEKKYGKFDLTFCLGLIYHLENPILALRKMREVTKQYCIIDTQTIRFDPKKENDNTIKVANGSKDDIWETESVIGIYPEFDFEKNQCASITGLSCIPNKIGLLKILEHVGFSKVMIIDPPEEAYEQYANRERVIVVAKV